MPAGDRLERELRGRWGGGQAVETRGDLGRCVDQAQFPICLYQGVERWLLGYQRAPMGCWPLGCSFA